MKNRQPIAIIGGYDFISKSFFSKVKLINNKSIYINVSSKRVKRKGVFNFEIYELKKILNVLKKSKVNELLFLGKINRPNLSKFKKDGEIDKYLPIFIDLFQKGDGNILNSVIKIFSQKGFKVISPRDISNSFFINKYELTSKVSEKDIYDIKKSIKLLNDLSKYDNAQSIIIVNGYIIAIEAAEGTDSLLIRSALIRKELKQLNVKAGLLVKLPKSNQSKLIDLPVIGMKTLNLVKKVNLNGIAINSKYTIVDNKSKVLNYAKDNDLKIYDIK